MSDDRTYELLEQMRGENRESHGKLYSRIDDLTARMTTVEHSVTAALQMSMTTAARVGKIERVQDEERGRRGVWRVVGTAAWGLLVLAFGAILGKIIPNH